MWKAEFFDVFGAVGFLYIAILSVFMLIKNGLPKWTVIVLLVIGIVGFVIDSTIVAKTYLIKK